MTSSSLSLNGPKIFIGKNYQICSMTMKSYFITYAVCFMMEEKYLQHFAHPTIVQIKTLSKELLYKTMSWKVFLTKSKEEDERKRETNIQ